MKTVYLTLIATIVLSACSNPKSELPIYGEWQMIDWNGEGKPALEISLNFQQNGEYYDSSSEDAVWNYEYFSPDSLILFHHGFYEERYRILNATNDTLVIRLSESIFHTEENGNEVASRYDDNTHPQFIFIRRE